MYNELKEFLKCNKHYRFLWIILKSLQFCFRQLRNVVLCIVRPLIIESYLKSHRIRKLQLGACRNVFKGWLNTDALSVARGVIPLNVTKPFPVGDGTFDYIFSEHIIEHLAYDKGIFMLSECCRILKPGGRIRIATVDLEVLIGLYTHRKEESQRKYIKWIIDNHLPQVDAYRESFVINAIFKSWKHKFIYDRSTLQYALEKAGFVDVRPCKVQESDDENLRGIEHHGRACGNEEMNKFETFVLEAKRPE